VSKKRILILYRAMFVCGYASASPFHPTTHPPFPPFPPFLPTHPPTIQEGLSDWQGAVNDYSRAISLWGGGRGEGINPFVLTFRGNALARLGRYKDALQVRVLLACWGGFACVNSPIPHTPSLTHSTPRHTRRLCVKSPIPHTPSSLLPSLPPPHATHTTPNTGL
jgi:hypothetical protein